MYNFTGTKEVKKMDALDRAYQLIRVSTQNLPPLAGEFMKIFCMKCACLEVVISAYAIYAQLEEGCPCRDDLYIPREEDKVLFFKVKNALN